MPSSVTSVFPVSGKLGLATNLHTLNTGRFCAEGLTSISHATLHRKAGGFLVPLLCVGPSARNCHRPVKILDMSDERTDQLMRKTLFLLSLVRCVLALSS